MACEPRTIPSPPSPSSGLVGWRSVGVWSVCRLRGRKDRRLSFHYSSSSYMLRFPSVITPSHHTNELSPQATQPARQPQARATPSLQQNSEESPPYLAATVFFTTSGSVCHDHQFTDCCSGRESPTLPAQLASPAGPTGFARRSSAPAPAPGNFTWHISPLLDSLPGAGTGRHRLASRANSG
jgi:hypothetical protein